jgi:hypothetical protein
MRTVLYESQLKLGPKKSVSIRREMFTVSVKDDWKDREEIDLY